MSGINVESEAARYRRIHSCALFDRIDIDISTPGATHVTLRFDVPEPPRRGWHVTTDERSVPKSFTSKEARAKINLAEQKDRNRRLFVTGAPGEENDRGERLTWAAALFHVDPKHEGPVVLSGIAMLPKEHPNRGVSELAAAFLVETLALVDAKIVLEHHEQRGAPTRRALVGCDRNRVLLDDRALVEDTFRFTRFRRPDAIARKENVDWFGRHARPYDLLS